MAALSLRAVFASAQVPEYANGPEGNRAGGADRCGGPGVQRNPAAL
jgi:hypothetical protein